jgi:sulfate permease, SulP family
MAAGPAARVRSGGTGLAALVLAAGVIAVLAVVIAASFGALIFSGPLQAHVAEGVGLLLFTVAVISAVSAWRSSFPGTIAGAQDNTSIVLAVTGASIVAAAPAGTADEVVFGTVVATIVVGSALTGLTFFLLGRFRLGELIRYIPYPVIGGFLAGTGWLLVVGGVDVAVGFAPAWSTLPDLVAGETLLRWVPATVFAFGLLAVLRRSGRPLLLPGALVAAIVAFYALLMLIGISVEQAQADGWLLGPFPEGVAWRPLTLSAATTADWGLVAGQAPNLATLVVIASVSLLLNATGVEVATGQDLDLNRELRVAGLGNLLTASGGGAIGYMWASITVLADRLGASRRATGLLVSATCLTLLIVGLDVVAYVPLPVVAAVLVFLGFSFLADWLVDGWARLPPSEYVVVAAIVAAIGLLGLLEGVALGLVLAVVLFVVRYSRTSVVKHALDASMFTSNVDRSPGECRILAEEGGRVLVLELQGFVFFGTAAGIHRLVETRSDAQPQLSYVLLDFRRVTGVDSSATFSLVKLARLASRRGATLVLTGLDEHTRTPLARGGLAVGDGEVTREFADLDHGLEWCEDQLIAAREGAGPNAAGQVAPFLGLEPARFEPYVERRRFAAGDVLIAQGEVAPGLFFVESGRISAVLEAGDGLPVRLRAMRPGALIGELSYFLDQPATATVVADTAVQAAVLPVDALERLERDEPELAAALHRRLVALIAERLATSNRVLRALKD